ncbi:MAG TPA: hypothetical protein VNE40_01265 [Candidatus Dormibacteraeota bacterium]|nr:hypothetical protein [Candidatus Dormibacteraeota bacterium]
MNHEQVKPNFKMPERDLSLMVARNVMSEAAYREQYDVSEVKETVPGYGMVVLTDGRMVPESSILRHSNSDPENY